MIHNTTPTPPPKKPGFLYIACAFLAFERKIKYFIVSCRRYYGRFRNKCTALEKAVLSHRSDEGSFREWWLNSWLELLCASASPSASSEIKMVPTTQRKLNEICYPRWLASKCHSVWANACDPGTKPALQLTQSKVRRPDSVTANIIYSLIVCQSSFSKLLNFQLHGETVNYSVSSENSHHRLTCKEQGKKNRIPYLTLNVVSVHLRLLLQIISLYF